MRPGRPDHAGLNGGEIWRDDDIRAWARCKRRAARTGVARKQCRPLDASHFVDVTTRYSNESGVDACPMCDADLGRSRGATRHQPLLSGEPGVFLWRCPDGTGVWRVATPAAAHTTAPAPA